MLVILLITIPTFLLALLKRSISALKGRPLTNDLRKNKSLVSPGLGQEKPSKELSNTWVLLGWNAFYISDSLEVGERTNISTVTEAWLEKRKHYFFDKSISVVSETSEALSDVWLKVVQTFEKLKSREINLIIEQSEYDTAALKRSGGAATGVATENASLSRALPKGIKSKDVPLSISARSCTLYFFPTTVFIEQGISGIISTLEDIQVRCWTSNYVGIAPSDSEVIGATWKHVNVTGERDKRIKNNKKLDRYKVDVLELAFANSGKLFEFHFSKSGCVADFVEAFSLLRQQVRMDALELLP